MSKLLVSAAMAFAERGRAIFPCRPRAKTPLTAHGFQDASADPSVISSWWSRWPEANIGLPTGGDFFVLDVDGPEGAETLTILERENSPIPRTQRARTGSGGQHIYFAAPELAAGERIGNRAGFAVGLDVRAQGGYVIAPPSVTTGPYLWTDRAARAPAPPWLLELIVERPAPPRAERARVPRDDARLSRYVRMALEREAELVAKAAEGSRNMALNRAAFKLGTLVGAGVLDERTARGWLLANALNAGLGEREANRTISSGMVKGIARPRVLDRWSA